MSCCRPRRRLRERETSAYVLHDHVEAGDPVGRNEEQSVVDIRDGIDVADLASSEEGEGGQRKERETSCLPRCWKVAQRTVETREGPGERRASPGEGKKESDTT
jgi:hypothetical protein